MKARLHVRKFEGWKAEGPADGSKGKGLKDMGAEGRGGAYDGSRIDGENV